MNKMYTVVHSSRAAVAVPGSVQVPCACAIPISRYVRGAIREPRLDAFMQISTKDAQFMLNGLMMLV